MKRQRPPAVDRVVLAPREAAVRERRLGLLAGEATMRADFDELPPDIAVASGME